MTVIDGSGFARECLLVTTRDFTPIVGEQSGDSPSTSHRCQSMAGSLSCQDCQKLIAIDVRLIVIFGSRSS